MSLSGTILKAVGRVAKDVTALRKVVEQQKMEFAVLKQAQASALAGTLPSSHLNYTQLQYDYIGDAITSPEVQDLYEFGPGVGGHAAVCTLLPWIVPNRSHVFLGFFVGEIKIEGIHYPRYIIFSPTGGHQVLLGTIVDGAGSYTLLIENGYSPYNLTASVADYFTRDSGADYIPIAAGTPVLAYFVEGTGWFFSLTENIAPP